MQTPLRAAAQLGRDVSGLIWAPPCVLCACDTAGRPLCEACHEDLLLGSREPCCDACGKPIGGAGGPCPWCDGRGLGSIRQVVRLGAFGGGLRLLIHKAKFDGQWELATWLGETLADTEAAGRLLGREGVVVVPVPLHPRRRITRGYDQAQLLAKALAKHFNLPLINALRRGRATVPQTTLTSVAARRSNVRNAFSLQLSARLDGLHAVLVDDVTTTGATLRAAARTLQPARPQSLSAAVVAVADPRHEEFESI